MTDEVTRGSGGARNKIWPSEDLFPGLIQHIAKKLFNKLDKKLSPRALVLFMPTEDNREAGVALKPEDECGYEPNLFANVLAKANECYKEKEVAYLGGRFPAMEVDRRRLEAFQEAVQEILAPSDAQRGIVSYCSQPVKFNGDKVCCILQLDANAYAAHYSLPEAK